jgi:hypothetical protein
LQRAFTMEIYAHAKAKVYRFGTILESWNDPTVLNYVNRSVIYDRNIVYNAGHSGVAGHLEWCNTKRTPIIHLVLSFPR